MTDAAEHPTGAPQSVAFDGIVEGRVADAAVLAAGVAQLNRRGVLTLDCEIDGGRFTLLPETGPAVARGLDEAAQADLLLDLTTLLQGASEGSVESTLRCRMLFPTQVVETWFRVVAGRVEPLSRVRTRTPADEPAAPADAAPTLPRLRRRDLLLMAPLLLIVGLLVAWQSGLIDRVLAARAETIRCDAGPFGTMLEFSLQRSWGNYRVEIRRGPGYPPDPDALRRAQAEAGSLVERAACDVVGGGGELWLLLRAEDGGVLDAVRAELRPLLAAADGRVVGTLRGQMGAARVELSLTEKGTER